MSANTAGALARLGPIAAAWTRSGPRISVRRPRLLFAVSVPLVAALLLLVAWPGRSEVAINPRTVDRVDLIAGVVAYEIHLAAGRDAPTAGQMAAIRAKLPALAFADGREIYVADANGIIVASSATDTPRTMAGLLADGPTVTVGHSGNVGRTRLRDGTPVLVAVRHMPSGHVAVVQPHATSGTDDRHAVLTEAAPIAGLLALAGLGAGCLHYRRNVRLDRQRRSRTHRIDTSLTHGRCGVWDWDATRQRVFWSASMYQILGYEPRGEHMTAGEVIALCHPEDGGVRDLLAALAAQDVGALDREIRVRTAQGEWLWLRIKGESVNEPADGSRHLVGLAIDVTAERRAAEQRARDDLRLRDAVEALSEAFVLWDEEERLIVCNSKFLALNGVSDAHAVAGTPAREILAAGRPPLVSRPLDIPAADSEDTRRSETQTADGRWFHVSERRTRDGGVVSLGTDVSELKRKEERLQAREQHLQGSVRAAETAAQCYALAAERNYEANQAKTEFLARVSHELRTPLNAIIGFSDVMRQQILGPLDDRYVGYTAGIHASGVKLLEIIDGILQMSRIEKGQFDFSPELLSVADVVKEAVATVRTDVDAKSVDIETDVPQPLILQADGAAIREILIQLVRNAVKFSACEGRVRVRVRPALERINIFVEDAGIGIPAELLPELGRPFAQVEAEYHRSCGGAGLGLAIVQSLLDMHGGRLLLRSQPGIGTVAMVSLSRVLPAANDASEPVETRARLAAAG